MQIIDIFECCTFDSLMKDLGLDKTAESQAIEFLCSNLTTFYKSRLSQLKGAEIKGTSSDARKKLEIKSYEDPMEELEDNIKKFAKQVDKAGQAVTSDSAQAEKI